MTYSPTSTPSPNSPTYNLNFRPGSADFSPYPGPQAPSKHNASSGNSTSSWTSSTAKTEVRTPSDTDSDYGTHKAARSLRQLSMADDQHEGKGKGKAPSRHTSPSGSSQGDVADNETEAGASQIGDHADPPPLPKKKRTRTLTTPHQAAVLHALLAQSRFPTTAMREEVGRSIGLSARKVQIWFQNQRQKARRPRGQNVPPLTRPPQYGPFPSAASTQGEHVYAVDDLALAESSQSARLRAAPFGSPTSPELDPFAWRDLHSPEGYPRSAALTSQLSGPGIPGSSTAPSSPHAVRSAPYPLPDSLRPQTSHIAMSSSRRHTVPRPVTADEGHRVYSLSQPMSPSHRYPTDYAITLPPLRLSRPRSRTFAEHGLSHRVTSPLQIMRRAQSPSAGPSQLPPLHVDSPSAYETSLNIPPPFTLQPRPQWDDPSFSPFSRPSQRSGHQYTISSLEAVTLPPPSTPQGGLTFPSPHAATTISPILDVPFSAAHTSLYLPTSPPGPTSPWRSRRLHDDDVSSRDHDTPR